MSNCLVLLQAQTCSVNNIKTIQRPTIKGKDVLMPVNQGTIAPTIDTINKLAYFIYNAELPHEASPKPYYHIIECRSLNDHSVKWTKIITDPRHQTYVTITHAILNNYQELVLGIRHDSADFSTQSSFVFKKEISIIILDKSGDIRLNKSFIGDRFFYKNPEEGPHLHSIVPLENGTYAAYMPQVWNSSSQQNFHLLFFDKQMGITKNEFFKLHTAPEFGISTHSVVEYDKKLIFFNSIGFPQASDSPRGIYHALFSFDPAVNKMGKCVRYFQPWEKWNSFSSTASMDLSWTNNIFRVNDTIVALPRQYAFADEIMSFSLFNLRTQHLERAVLLQRPGEFRTFISHISNIGSKFTLSAEVLQSPFASFSESNSKYFTLDILTNSIQNEMTRLRSPSDVKISSNLLFSQNDSSYFITNGLRLAPLNSGFPPPLSSEFTTYHFSKALTGNCIKLDTNAEFFTTQRTNYGSMPLTLSIERIDTNTIKESQSYLQLTDINYTTDTLCYETISCSTPVIQGMQKICDTSNTYSYTYSASSCKGNYTWIIPEDAALQLTNNVGQEQLNLKWKRAGTFVLYLKPNWCTNPADSMVIEVTPYTHKNYDAATKVLCTGDTYTLTAPSGLYNLRWNSGEQTSSKTVQNTGTYWYTGNDACGHSFSDTMLFTKDENDYRFSTTIEICKGYDSILVAPLGPVRYRWTGPNTSASDTLQNLRINASTNSAFDVWMTDNTGCIQKGLFRVMVNNCTTSIYVPTAFTPNQDGLNDTFRPILQGRVEYYRFEIRNRWGQRIFSKTQAAEGWNGSINGQPQPSGLYVWQLVIKFRNEPEKKMSGNVKLIR